ncbi:hypothetical protein DPQ22_09525 [Candidatus Tokpelaia sp.]|nr:hypothetical protein DPQ22_09525 [Candidatus Tokpelaia sp.]
MPGIETCNYNIEAVLCFCEGGFCLAEIKHSLPAESLATGRHISKIRLKRRRLSGKATWQPVMIISRAIAVRAKVLLEIRCDSLCKALPKVAGACGFRPSLEIMR